MALANLFPDIDDRPASHGQTLNFVDIPGAGTTDLTTLSGKPAAPTSAILIQSATGGNVVLTMLGGGNITLTMAGNQTLYLRIAIIALVDTGTVNDGTITVFWNASAHKNP